SAGLKLNLSEGENKTDGGGVNSVDPWPAVAQLAYDDPGGRWGARLTGTFRKRKDDPSTLYLESGLFVPPASYVLDLSTYWLIREYLSLDLGVRNVTNQRYWTWPNAGSVDHDFLEDPELSVQPGTNFY